jgi:PAS domain S-box-containing protein
LEPYGSVVPHRGQSMQTFYKRFGVVAGFAVLLTLLIGNALVTRRQVSIQVRTESLVSHTRQVLFELKQTELVLLDAEAEKRGFLFTGNSEYLSPYNAAIAQLEPQLDRIANLTADNPRQQAQITVLRNQVHAKVAEMAEAISLKKSGKPEAAKELVLLDTARLTVVRIRQTIAQMEAQETALESQRAAAYEISIRRTMVSIYSASLLAALGLMFLGYYILREINLREKHTQELRASEEWFRVTLTSIGDAVIATDKQGAVTFLNRVAESLTQTSLAQAKGRNINEVFPICNELTNKPVENPVQKVLSEGRVVGLANHTALKRRDGTQVPIQDSAAPIRGEMDELLGVVLVFRDVSNERKSEVVMRQAERLAAAARLSATMAHEINNPLQAVSSLVYLARSTPEAPPSMIQQLTAAEEELKRIAHITQQTLGFYRDSQATELIDMPALIESVFALYSNKFQSKNIRIERHFHKYPRVRAVSGEIKQVISNLIANAADAVGNKGTIAVTLGSIQNDGQTMLQMLIEDDGSGIPPEHLQHLFEPFFTTKKNVGTGLGLWLTKEIVDRYGGNIEVRPRVNGAAGAALCIILPSAANPSEAAAGNGEVKALHT